MQVSQSLPGMPVSGIFCSGVSKSPVSFLLSSRLLVTMFGWSFNSGRNFAARSGVMLVGVSHQSTAIGP